MNLAPTQRTHRKMESMDGATQNTIPAARHISQGILGIFRAWLTDSVGEQRWLRPVPVIGGHWDTLLLALALVLGNLHLIGWGQPVHWIFQADRVAAGEWWRIFTHPFVHLSWYHLALDGAAFFLLYAELRRSGWPLRLKIMLLCSGGSLLAAWLWAPQVALLGLCGLSGTAHGLMAFGGLARMRDRRTRLAGGVVFGLVAAKSIMEGITGEVVFTFMHMGLCGTPIAMAHLGGVAGGVSAGLLNEKSGD